MNRNDKKKVEKVEEVDGKVEKGEKKDEETKGTEETKETQGNDEIGKLKKRIEELENQTRRTLADYQNLEKRTREQQREMILSANKQLLLKILPILDTLMMAASHVNDQGIELSLKQFLDTLKTEGVERIETTGKAFDPYIMEAVETVDPTAGSGQEGKVVEETMAGYTLYDKVLRPARVKVGKGENSAKRIGYS